MITTEDNELGDFIYATLEQINRGARLAERDLGMPVRLPKAVEFRGEVVRLKSGETIVRGLSASITGESTSTSTDTGENTTQGTTQSTQGGGNRNITTDEYAEK
jgi:hypothetical protein